MHDEATYGLFVHHSDQFSISLNLQDGTDMIEVQCPICDENMKGEGEFDLSINLQEHMRRAHDFKDLAKIEAGKCPDARPCAEGLGSLSYDERTIIESHGPLSMRQVGEDITESVRCPLCGYVVHGDEPPDLSYNLSAHMASEHDVKRRIGGRG